MKTKLLIVPVFMLVLGASCNRQAEVREQAALDWQAEDTEQTLVTQQAEVTEQDPVTTKAEVSEQSVLIRQAESGKQTPASRQVSMEETKTHSTIKLNREDFLSKVMNYEVNQTEWVFEGDKPCLVDFYADWCAPCRISSPILEELAVEYGDRINIYKVDTQREQELAMVFGIQSIPSFLFCPMEGRPVMSSGIAQDRHQTKEMFRRQIEELLLKGNISVTADSE